MKRAEAVRLTQDSINKLFHVMFSVNDVARKFILELTFDDLQKMWVTAKWVTAKKLWPARSPYDYEEENLDTPRWPSFRGRMQELTKLLPWRASRALTRTEMEWLSKMSVRTELHVGKRPIHTNVPRFDASEVWTVNGEDRTVVGPNGEFWLADTAAAAVPATQQWMQSAEMHVPAFVSIPVVLPDDEDEAEALLLRHRRLLHREDGPAVRDSAGYELWVRHGILHRVDGPAIVRPDRANQAKRQLWFFRGAHVPGGQAELDELAKAAPLDPMFDDSDAKRMALPDGILFPALPTTAIVLPSFPPPLLAMEEMFEASGQTLLDRLMEVDLPIKSIEFSKAVDGAGGETTHILKFAPRKPLCDVLREDVAVFMNGPMTEAYFYDMRMAAARPGAAQVERVLDDSFEMLAIWGYPRAALVNGDRIVQVKVNEVGQARIRIDNSDDDDEGAAAAAVQWDVVNADGTPWIPLPA